MSIQKSLTAGLKILVAFAALFGCIFLACAETFSVSNIESLTAALAQAQDGDEILLAGGTYETEAEFVLDKAIRLAGDPGATRESVILKSTGASRVLTIDNAGAILSSLTVANGVAAFGGGAFLKAGTITNCCFNGNTATANYDGKYNNSGAGGAVFVLAGGGGQIIDSEFVNNQAVNGNAQLSGGALASNARIATEKVIRCRFDQNAAYNGGGAYRLYLFDPTFVAFKNPGRGGLYANNCAIFRATVDPAGLSGQRFLGGIFVDCQVYDTLFKGLHNGSGDGLQNGAVFVGGGSLYNCTFTGCFVQSNYLTKQTTLYNCVVWGNQNNPNAGDSGKSYNSCLEKLMAGNGNISVDPHLAEDGSLGVSVCLNGARVDNTYFPETENRAVDAAGNPREALGGIDLGCFERQTLSPEELSVYIPRDTLVATLGERQNLSITAIAVPELAVSLTVAFGDGVVETVSREMVGVVDTFTFAHTYPHSGAFTPSVTLTLGELKTSDTASGLVRVRQDADALYVSSDGDDASSGVSDAMAKKTLFQALCAARDGATIHLLPGVLLVGEESSLTVDRPVQIVGAGVGRTRVTGASGLSTITLNDPSAKISGIGFYGITNTCDLIVATVGAVANCVFDQISLKDCRLIDLGWVDKKGAGRADDCTISRSSAKYLIKGNNSTRSFARDMTVIDSIGTGTGAAGESVTFFRSRFVRDTSSDGLLYNCEAYDCLFAENHTKASCILYNTTSYNCTFINNTGVKDVNRTSVLTRSRAHYNALIYNNWWSTANGTETGRMGGTDSIYYNCWVEEGTEGYTDTGGNLIGTDPRVRADGRLFGTSPCVAAGSMAYYTSNKADQRPTDLAGNPRVRGRDAKQTIDIGCLQNIPTGLKVFVK